MNWSTPFQDVERCRVSNTDMHNYICSSTHLTHSGQIPYEGESGKMSGISSNNLKHMATDCYVKEYRQL